MTQALPDSLKMLGARTPSEIRDAMLRSFENHARDAGLPVPDLSPGSFDYVRATLLGEQQSLIEAFALFVWQQVSSGQWVGEQLDRVVAKHGLSRRTKAGSIGKVTFTSSAASAVPTGAQLTSATGIKFEVVTGGVYADQDPIEVRAIDTGVSTNLDEGTVLQWVSAPPFADAKVRVGPGDLINGVEDESDAELFARYLAKLRTPPTESNAQALCERAEDSHPAVQKAFCYPALLGPSTYALAVAAAPTASDKGREVAALTVTNEVAPIVAGTHLDALHPKVVSVVNEQVYWLSIGLSLPAARSAGGAGGGWVNGQPWPPAEPEHGLFSSVYSASSSTRFVVVASADPIIGVSRISWLSPNDWKLRTATVVDASRLNDDHVEVTIDTPFVGIALACMVWPAAERAQAYVDAILQAFELMGPGQMSDQESVLRRSTRHPAPADGWPWELGVEQMKYLTDAGPEVRAASIYYASKTTPTVSDVAPRILTPLHIGFYPRT